MGREPTAERRIEILETAVSLFLSQGYLRTSMQDVAETASVSKATLYQILNPKKDWEPKQCLFLRCGCWNGWRRQQSEIIPFLRIC